jgi:acetyl-CoA synthetase
MSQSNIESVLRENRTFTPPPAPPGSPWHIKNLDEYRAMWQRSIDDPEGFWGEQARQCHWFSPWSKVLEWDAPDARWFVGGKTNVCDNCVDRVVDEGHGDQTAIIWEGEPTDRSGDNRGTPEVRRLSYADLKRRDGAARQRAQGDGRARRAMW